MKKLFSWSSFCLLGLIGVMVLLSASSAHAATTKKVVVTAADLDNTSSNPAVVATDGLHKWFMYNDTNDTIDNTLGSFVQGPGTPPHGKGSVQFTLGASPLDRENIATYQFSGTALASITQMSFSAYSHSGVAGPTESPFLNFNVDFIGSSSAFQGRLVYVPGANGAVPQDTWNTFDVIKSGTALWTWSHYASNGNKWPDNNTSQYRTWSAIQTAFPNARLLPVGGWLGIRVGEPGPTNYSANIDSFTLGTAKKTTIFTFEPVVQPNKTYHIEVHTTNNPDSGTCGNNWALDSFDRTFTVKSSDPNTIQESFDNAKFVTVAGQSPDSCQLGNTHTVGLGIHGSFTGEETVVVTGGTFNPKAQCSKTTPCNSTTAFVQLFYGAHATWTSPSFEFNYDAEESGHWQNASADEGGNTGDITGLVDKDGD